MKPRRHLNPAILVLLLGQFVPFVACTADDQEEDIREENDCQSLVPCDSARFSFSDTLAAGQYDLLFALTDDEIDCTLSVEENGATSDDCDFDWLALTDEYLEVGPETQSLTLTVTDENGCSASTSVSASDYVPLGDECGADCEGATTTLDLSECAEDWEAPQTPTCEIGYEWSEVCDTEYQGTSTQIIEGCGYTWIRGLNTDIWRDTIIDEDGVVVFQERRGPLSTTNSSGCTGGAIPDCADLPDDTNNDWDGPPASEGDVCLDDEAQPERPACAVGYESSNVCGEFGGFTTQIIEGCGYTWIRGLYADSQRDTIVDADGIVVFQEWSDPMSTINPLGCLGGTIPDCADLPDDTSDYWNSPAPFPGNECPDDGMGGMGGGAGRDHRCIFCGDESQADSVHDNGFEDARCLESDISVSPVIDCVPGLTAWIVSFSGCEDVPSCPE